MKKNQLPLFLGLGALVLVFLSGVTAYLLAQYALVWQICLGLAVAATIGYVVLERAFLKQVLSKRTTQYGLNSVLMSVIALVIVVVLNLIGTEHDIKKDFTKNKVHTLSDQSVKILGNLKQEVRLRTFANPDQTAGFDKIFQKYTYVSKMVKPEFVDVDKDPTAVQRYQVKTPGTIVVETDVRSVKVDNIYGPDDPKVEEKITNAIIQVAKGDKKKVYFVTGHGEKLPNDTGREGLSEIKDSLENGRYKVEPLVLVEKDKMPADAELVVVAGPRSELLAQEMKILEDYVKGGGKMLLMLDPDSSPGFKEMLAKFGVDWKAGDAILETNPLQQLARGNPLYPIVVQYDTTSEITNEFKQQPTIFPIAGPVEKSGNVPNGYKVTSLFSTSTKSFVMPLKEIQAAKDGRLELDERKMKKGPFSLAVSVSGKIEGAKPPDPKEKKDESKPEKEPEFRLVVVGDSDFASNGFKKNVMNSDLFQNMMAWLAHEEDLIAIRPKAADASEFNITEERARIIVFASVFFAPFLMWAMGIAVWVVRRRR